MDQDLADLLIAWLGGEIPDARRGAVLARLRDDPAFRAEVARELHLLGMLKVLRTSAPRWLRLEDELGWSANEPAPATALADAVAAEVERLPAHQPSEPSKPAEPPTARRFSARRWAMAAAVLVAVGGVVALIARRPGGVVRAPVPDEAIAFVVRLHNPVWESESGPSEGSIVRTGVLSLRGGTATLALFNGVTLHVEGPADIDLQTPNRVFCRRGKFRIEAPIDSAGFSAQAPGTSVADPAADFGLTVDGDKSAVMVFDGQAEVALLDKNGATVRSEMLTGGQAVRLDAQAGSMSAGEDAPGAFAGPIPRLDPRLVLDPEYAATVRTNRPAGYWRFESTGKGTTPNEIPGGPALRLIGQAAPTDSVKGNRSLNFPPATEWDQHGALSERPWAPTGREYAIECWVMPRLVRQAALVGLVADATTVQLRKYGILLELTGHPSLFRHPVRSVRALHRFPVEQVRGTNLFTPMNYLPYRWQHLVCQRAGNRFELYVDGELAAVAPITSDAPLPPFRVLLGALYARRDGTSVSERPFVGLIDEVAVYDHSLPAADVLRHAKLGSSIRALE